MFVTSERGRRQRGTTLIELMIALVLTGVVTLAIMNTYVTQHESYIAQDNVAVMQQSARACLDELTRQVRMAGYRVPLGLDPIVASNADPDTITVVYRSEDCETFLTADMGSTSDPLTVDDESCFRQDQWVYIYDPDSARGEWLQISEVQSGQLLHAFSPANLSRTYRQDALVIPLNMVRFYVDDYGTGSGPVLMVQVGFDPAQIYADNISDLQLRYRLTNGHIVDVPVLVNDVREVLISLTAQSADDQVGEPEEESERKSRTYSSSACVRNIGL